MEHVVSTSHVYGNDSNWLITEGQVYSTDEPGKSSDTIQKRLRTYLFGHEARRDVLSFVHAPGTCRINRRWKELQGQLCSLIMGAGDLMS